MKDEQSLNVLQSREENHYRRSIRQKVIQVCDGTPIVNLSCGMR